MNLNKASEFFKKLIAETNDKSEIRVYQKFISILFDLENKALTTSQLRQIEKELETIDLTVNSENRKRYFKQKLIQFANFLKKNFSMVSEGYYTSIGMTLGLSFGVAFGAAFDNVSYGLIIGMLIGLVVGATMDSNAKKEGKVIKTNLN
jgi:TPP-dependent 2-oxoacid decarboxylase